MSVGNSNDFSYWIPLEFEEHGGRVRKFAPFVDSWELGVPPAAHVHRDDTENVLKTDESIGKRTRALLQRAKYGH